MSFFKEFKEDLSAATNELLPGDESKKESMGKQEDNDVDVDTELEKLGDLLQGYTSNEEEQFGTNEDNKNEKDSSVLSPIATTVKQPKVFSENKPVSKEETTVITNGMVITGNLESASAVEIKGIVNGDVQCVGKLSVTGSINGNTNSSEFFADEAQIEGDIVATGAVKVGAGSVIIGGISASSAVIAGAVKGDLDVRGPVIIDSSAVILGNIKSRSIQINNGAVLEGFCSQSYSDVDVQSIFG